MARRAAPATADRSPPRAHPVRSAKRSGHVATTADCATCHKSTAIMEWRRVRPCGNRHQLFELPQRHDCDRHGHAAAYSDRDAPMQQLSYQHGGKLHLLHDEPPRSGQHRLRNLSQRLLSQRRHIGGTDPDDPAAYPDRDPRLRELPHQYDELDHLHDEPCGGGQHAVQLLSQWILHEPGHVGCADARAPAISPPPPTADLPQDTDDMGWRCLRPCGDRHQLFELPQWHDRDRHDHATAYSDPDHPVQQLSHQYGGELHLLHNEPRGGDEHRMRRPVTMDRSPARGRLARSARGLATSPPQPTARLVIRAPHHGLALPSPMRQPTPIVRAATMARPRPA